ncbi:roundabout homolog 3 [Gadus chalcogrammus]|uniref:roundabout homolog 3 n=1 Tax=Gadus chalcogrammus TaxID=1042646 RepID=UPI0024C3B6D2|nr:roundabout homolog 3 [Gadus chalcogrammus]
MDKPRAMEHRPVLVILLVLLGFSTLTYGSRPRLEDAAPRVVEHPSDLIVSKGEPATLNCKAEGRPSPMVEWYKDGERVETDREDPRSHRMLLPSGSLFFLRIVHGRRSKPDEGVYVCVARNYLGEAVSRNASLEVAILREDFRQTPSDVVVAAGEPAVMECIPPRGHPEPTISWKRNNVRVNDRDERITIRGGKLMISNTRKSDAGMYVCVGTNMVGEKDSDPAELVVFERPVFTKQPVNQVVLADDTVDFSCEVYGDPTPTVRWRREEGELPRGRFEIRGDNSLRLSQVRAEDEGTYTCVSENAVGKAEVSGILQVHGKTREKETDSGVYTCVASSSSGETSWSGVLTVKESADQSGSQNAEPFQLPGPPHKPVVTDVTKASVTLTWQPNAHEGGADVTSYIVEAFSQSAGSTWQTVADNVKMETHTIMGLFPNTIYLFIVRAVNAYGLSDPSPISEPVRTQDVSPTGQGVDHKQVQRELGEVDVQLKEPVSLTTGAIQISWTVDRQSQYVQGYRLLYRPGGGTWVLQDVNSPSERSSVLGDLLKGTKYEFKIRPYFDEFQGRDSRVLSLQTPEEAPSAPPRAVTVVTVKQGNSSSVSVTWEPPPSDMQNGVIQDYKVWCLGVPTDNQTRYSINKTVEGSTLSTVLKGLVPGVVYQVEVAAVTSAGVGTRSQPVSVLIKLQSEQAGAVGSGANGANGVSGGGGGGGGGGAEGGAPSSNGDGGESSVSLAEQITDVVKQPAFIAGIGGACWVILMGFSVWIYIRRKKRKELSHYTASFAYTPAVGFPHGDGSGLNGRPGMMAGSMGNYPWLADSWPTTTTNLVHNSKEAVDCCPAKHDATDRYYNEAGISNYLSQTEKCSLGDSTEGPIYSTIDPTGEDLASFHGYGQHATPYASTSLTPYAAHNPELGPTGQQLQQQLLQPEEGHWATQPGPSGAQYALPDRCSGKPKQKPMGKAVKTPSLSWTEVLPPPPPTEELDHCVLLDPPELQDMEIGSEEEEEEEEEEWCPPLPERTYLMEDACSPATSYSHQSTATLTPSPHEETPAPHHAAHFSLLDGAQHPARRRLPCGPVPMPQAPGAPLTQSNPNLSVGPYCQSPAHRNPHSPGGTLEGSDSSPATPVHGRDVHGLGSQKSRLKKKASKSGPYRRDIQGDLPPPPEPPPDEGDRLKGLGAGDRPPGAAVSSLEKREHNGLNHQRKGSGPRLTDGEDLVVYGSKAAYASRNHVPGSCSTTGSSSSRGSSGSRGPPSSSSTTRKHSEGERVALGVPQ